MKLKFAYLSYPYSDNPEKRTEEVIELSNKISARHRDLIIIIPHLVVDKGMSQSILHDKQLIYDWIPVWEYEIIDRCEVFIIGHELDYKISSGCVWEYAFARWKGKEILKAWELI